jgi:phosphoglycolate phosphatase
MMTLDLPTQKPALVIFDWDDTLVDNYAAIHMAINAARTHFGQPVWSLAETRVNCRRALNEIFPEWFGDAWLTGKKIFYEVFAAAHLAQLRVMPDAALLLSAIKAAGVPIAVNSNKNRDFLRDEIAHLGWGHYFSALVGAGDVARGKPAPDGVNAIRQELAVEATASVWFVGDNDLDAQTAQSGGCLPIILHRKTAPFPCVNDRVLLGNCGDLLELFKILS